MDTPNKKIIRTDILIVGGGGAGMFSAIKAKEAGAEKVTLVTKGKFGMDSVTKFAAGVLDVVTPDDDKEEEFKIRHLGDGWGAGLSDEEWVWVRVNEGYDRLSELMAWGVEFKKRPDGKIERLPMKRDAKKAMFHGTDLSAVMARETKKRGVEVIEHTMVTDLLTEGGNPGTRVVGAVGFGAKTGEFVVFEAKAVVLAPGGCGYKNRFACHRMVTGDGPAMAYRAGAIIGKLDQVAFHTTSTEYDAQGLNMFQGLGGKFINGRGEEFLTDYDPILGNHTSMSRLSHAGAMEVRYGRGPIYLDMTHFTPEQVENMRWVLPVPSAILERAGAMVGNRIVKKIPWAGVFYGSVHVGGGIEVMNTKCESSLPGLYSCGDSMAKAKNTRSLMAAFTSGARAGKYVAEYAKKADIPTISEKQVEQLRVFTFSPMEKKDGIGPDHLTIKLQEKINPYEVTMIMTDARLEKALETLEVIRDTELPMLFAPDTHYLRMANEVRSMYLFAEMQLRSIYFRKESRDSCLKEDYPYTDNINWLKWIRLKKEDGKMRLWTDDIEFKKLAPKRERFLHPVFEGTKKRENL